jgi:hypothetical protein
VDHDVPGAGSEKLDVADTDRLPNLWNVRVQQEKAADIHIVVSTYRYTAVVSEMGYRLEKFLVFPARIRRQVENFVIGRNQFFILVVGCLSKGPFHQAAAFWDIDAAIL